MSLETLLSVWAVAVLMAFAAIAAIARPLFIVLTDVCGGRDRARFWTVYASVLTLAAPLLVVSTPGLLDRSVAMLASGAVLQRTVFYALAGIVFALLVMGRAVWRPIARLLSAPVRPGDAAGPAS
jgi:hypothetical protein